ncbi:hypothetical protein DICA3_C05270 [Diutina catenulata]
MSGFKSPSAGAAAIVFIVLFSIYVLFVANIVIRKEGFRSLYTLLLIYGIIRWGAQLCGIVYSILGTRHWQWLVSYLVLGAEGYFLLVLSCFNYVAKSQTQQFGFSKLKPKGKEQKKKYALWGFLSPSTIFHWSLLPANILVVYGVTILGRLTPAEVAANPGLQSRSEGCRAAGQAMFLCLTLTVFTLSLNCYFRQKVRQPELYVIWFAFPFLLCRGIYGVISVFVPAMDLFDRRNYTINGAKTEFVIMEYCLAITTEFITAVMLVGVYYYKHYYRRDVYGESGKNVENIHHVDKNDFENGNPFEETDSSISKGYPDPKVTI